MPSRSRPWASAAKLPRPTGAPLPWGRSRRKPGSTPKAGLAPWNKKSGSEPDFLGGRRDLLEPVAVVVDRHHPVARFRPQVELLAHLADVRIDGAGCEVAGSAPHRLLQVAARQQ